MPTPPESARYHAPDTFQGDVCVVTGGGTGLGLEISRGLAALGATVVIGSRDPEHHTDLLAEAATRGWKVEAAELDVREPELVRKLCETVVERHGRVDVLVNNAAGNFVCPAERMSKNAWRAVLGIVLDGTFYCSQAFGRQMIRQGGGRMLNIVATYATVGSLGMAGVAHSASAKAGVLALTRSLASEWAHHGLRINAIAPGPFDSPGAAQNLWPSEEARQAIERTIPVGRFATVDEVARHAIWLLSPASEYITGECLVVDGGLIPGSSRMWRPGERFKRKRSSDPEPTP